MDGSTTVGITREFEPVLHERGVFCSALMGFHGSTDKPIPLLVPCGRVRAQFANGAAGPLFS